MINLHYDEVFTSTDLLLKKNPTAVVLVRQSSTGSELSWSHPFSENLSTINMNNSLSYRLDSSLDNKWSTIIIINALLLLIYLWKATSYGISSPEMQWVI
jgi:hypothetical protein